MGTSAVDVVEAGDDEHPLTVEGYDEFFSSFWPAEAPKSAVTDFYRDNPVDGPTEVVWQTREGPTRTTQFQEFTESVSDDEPLDLLRINTREYNLTWQHRDGSRNQVGYISDEDTVSRLTAFYESTTGQSLSEEAVDTLAEFVGECQDQ